MADKEKVIFDIERCICHVPDACRDCSHYKDDALDCMKKLLADALSMLKEQNCNCCGTVFDVAYKAGKADAVVRCKDCKYNDDGECIIKAGWFPVKPDWFCADGERRSE